MERLRQNTARIQFQRTDPKPSDLEMMKFVLDVGLTSKDVHTLYQDLYDRCVYIKFNTEQKYHEFILEKSVLSFTYTNGATAEVTVKGTSGVMRYVRVFNLPPEITDRTLSEAMQRFGNILSTRREKFGANSLLPVFSGVRGVYIEIEREIPQFIYIQNIKSRIYYDGMRERCFKCGEESHKKQDCPLLYNTINETSIQQPAQESQQQPKMPQELQKQQIQQQTQSEQTLDKQIPTKELIAVSSTNTHERVRYSDVAKTTQIHEETVKQIEAIQKMINIKEHMKERKQESESSCMETESEDLVENTSKRGRPAKKTRYTSTKNRIAFTEQYNRATSNSNTKNDNFIAPTPLLKNNADETV